MRNVIDSPESPPTYLYEIVYRSLVRPPLRFVVLPVVVVVLLLLLLPPGVVVVLPVLPVVVVVLPVLPDVVVVVLPVLLVHDYDVLSFLLHDYEEYFDLRALHRLVHNHHRQNRHLGRESGGIMNSLTHQ